MRDKINTALGIFLGLSAIFLFFAGDYHSEKKHSNDPWYLTHTPFLFYRGLEMFWHDDFRGVNWDQTLKNDAYILFQMMTTVASANTAESANSQIKKYSERISEYPSDKRMYLMNAGNTYYRYFITLKNETTAYLDSLEAGRTQFDPKDWNIVSSKIEDTIVRNYGIKELVGGTKLMDSILMEIRFAVSFGDPERASINKRNSALHTRDLEVWMERVHLQIFNQPLIPIRINNFIELFL